MTCTFSIPMQNHERTDLMKRFTGGRRSAAKVVSLLTAAALALSACGSGSGDAAEDGGAIKIGVIAALTGIAAPYGTQSLNSFKLAVEDINEAGGVDGRDLEVVALDNRSKPEEVPALMKRLASDGIDLIVGASSTPLTITAAQTADQVKVPLLVPMEAADAIIGEGREYVYKLAPSILAEQGWAAQGIRAAMKASEDAGDPIETVSIIYVSAGAGPEAFEAWERTLTEEYPEVEILDTTSYDEAVTSDFGPIVAKTKEQNPDLIGFFGNPQGSFLFYPALEGAGWHPKMTVGVLGGNTNAQFIPTVGKAAEGDMAGNYWTSLLKAGENAEQTPQGYVEDYSEKFDGQVPDGVGAYYYSAAAVIAEALSNADDFSDADAMNQALNDVEIEGINADELGLYIVGHGVKFDDRGFNERAVGLVTQIQDGKFVPIYPEEAADGTAIFPAR
ncbi:ABC-type branched-subunit amino acid transport system substrate-binding protein [Nocardioides salarius]|uniref:ABC-type branched-subunit amino acid transport system substrate-binding protein n=1 Tax=Nocardioides salarius TaxID=374513 RepID=A0ABS2MA48_9ACTN|nr:ABC transporter substrate-binding protein [Nocardioides salarius]MBM7508073.1 ABC-type branched-subunit amino acid transport system substrate-binding protein [Nocardioides salarius]